MVCVMKGVWGLLTDLFLNRHINLIVSYCFYLQRKDIVLEIIDSEQKYVNNLSQIQQV